MKNKIKVATVFSGIGALEWALKRLNLEHEIVFACDSGEVETVDIDYENELKKIKKISNLGEQKKYMDSFTNAKKVNFVKKSYLSNFGIEEEKFYSDVRLFDGVKFKDKVDLFVGGSPCQSFSTMGYKKGLEDARGTLFFDYARLVKEISPKVFIFENVNGLLKHDSGKTWDIISKIFNELNYKIFFKVLDSADFGIPQRRRRIFVVGFKNRKVEFEFPEKVDLNFKMQDFLEEKVPFGNFKRNKNGDVVLKRGVGLVEKKHILSSKVLAHVMSTGTKNYITKPEIDLSIARPLLSSMHKMHRAAVDNYVTTKFGVRRLTPRESLRLMGFDDEFKIVVSDTQMYKQAGNSIVVDVLMSLVNNIINTGEL
jgi:DNA (cytosine-5)-methyltransferase 1